MSKQPRWLLPVDDYDERLDLDLCIGLGAVLGGKAGQVLLWAGTVLGGVATVLVLVG